MGATAMLAADFMAAFNAHFWSPLHARLFLFHPDGGASSRSFLGLFNIAGKFSIILCRYDLHRRWTWKKEITDAA
jgi:hypothetical protein